MQAVAAIYMMLLQHFVHQVLQMYTRMLYYVLAGLQIFLLAELPDTITLSGKVTNCWHGI